MSQPRVQGFDLQPSQYMDKLTIGSGKRTNLNSNTILQEGTESAPGETFDSSFKVKQGIQNFPTRIGNRRRYNHSTERNSGKTGLNALHVPAIETLSQMSR